MVRGQEAMIICTDVSTYIQSESTMWRLVNNKGALLIVLPSNLVFDGFHMLSANDYGSSFVGATEQWPGKVARKGRGGRFLC